MARTGPNHWTFARGLEEPTLREIPATMQDAILATIAPHLRDGVDSDSAWREIAGALFMFARNDAAGMGTRAMAPRKQMAKELDRLRAAAESLDGAIAGLSFEIRARLWRTLGSAPASAVASGDADEVLELAAEVDELSDVPETLARIAILLNPVRKAAASEAELVRGEPRQKHRHADRAAHALKRDLERTWTRLTGAAPKRSRGADEPSLWEAFRSCVLDAAGARAQRGRKKRPRP